MSGDNVIAPLEGEPEIPGVASPRNRSNAKQLIAVAVLLLSVMAVLGFAISRYFVRSTVTPAKSAATPDVASARAPALQMPPPQAPRAAASAVPPSVPPADAAPIVPNIEPSGEAAPIPVRGTGGTAGTGAARKPVSPEDAPIFSAGAAPGSRTGGAAQARPRDTGDPVADANTSLDAYQRQLAGMLQNLQVLTAGKSGGRTATAEDDDGKPQADAATPAAPAAQRPQQTPPLFESMNRSATPTVQARRLANRSLTIPKGTLFLCSLKTRVISATSGFVGCQVTRNVFGDDGRVLLIERGSHMDGEYRIVSIRPGVTRIPVLWTRVRTPLGVSVDLDSPATGQLGESGLGGYVDNRWGERLGAALLLSLVDDAVRYAISGQSNTGESGTVVLPNTLQQGSKLAEKVLDATINIPPLLYQNQGGVVGVYVARDLDFSSVYELRPQ